MEETKQSTPINNTKKKLPNGIIACLAISVFLLVPCICCSSITFLAENAPPELTITSNGKTSWKSPKPSEIIRLSCTYTNEISLNEKSLTNDDKRNLCGSVGYSISLVDGINVLKFSAKSEMGKITELTLNITFSQAEYNDLLANEKIVKEKQEADAKAKAVADEKAKQEAIAKALAEKETMLNDYATRYCSERKGYSRTFGKIIVNSDNSWQTDVSKAIKGNRLSKSDCRNIVNSLVQFMEVSSGSVNKESMEQIISKKYWIGMYSIELVASIGNPDDVNTTTTTYSTSQQFVYYKDSYGISSIYIYTDGRKVTSYQDF